MRKPVLAPRFCDYLKILQNQSARRTLGLSPSVRFVRIRMRKPGFEPGSSRWQRDILTTVLLALLQTFLEKRFLGVPKTIQLSEFKETINGSYLRLMGKIYNPQNCLFLWIKMAGKF